MWSPVIQLVAVFTMFLGNILAFTQENIKRMLAYSSISHIPYSNYIHTRVQNTTWIHCNTHIVYRHVNQR